MKEKVRPNGYGGFETVFEVDGVTPVMEPNVDQFLAVADRYLTKDQIPSSLDALEAWFLFNGKPEAARAVREHREGNGDPDGTFEKPEDAQAYKDAHPDLESYSLERNSVTGRWSLEPSAEAARNSIDELIVDKLADGDMAGAKALRAFRDAPTQMDLFNRAIQIANSPGDFFTLTEMLRGANAVGGQPLPRSRIFDMFGIGAGLPGTQFAAGSDGSPVGPAGQLGFGPAATGSFGASVEGAGKEPPPSPPPFEGQGVPGLTVTPGGSFQQAFGSIEEVEQAFESGAIGKVAAIGAIERLLKLDDPDDGQDTIFKRAIGVFNKFDAPAPGVGQGGAEPAPEAEATAGGVSSAFQDARTAARGEQAGSGITQHPDYERKVSAAIKAGMDPGVAAQMVAAQLVSRPPPKPEPAFNPITSRPFAAAGTEPASFGETTLGKALASGSAIDRPRSLSTIAGVDPLPGAQSFGRLLPFEKELLLAKNRAAGIRDIDFLAELQRAHGRSGSVSGEGASGRTTRRTRRG